MLRDKHVNGASRPGTDPLPLESVNLIIEEFIYMLTP